MKLHLYLPRKGIFKSCSSSKAIQRHRGRARARARVRNVGCAYLKIWYSFVVDLTGRSFGRRLR
ncbi:hypothetical protein D1AOALGA4SA_3425 [Olavius algarvensis Delta 1 endosymbiont]|nr:hypothetical protein D1AOALGA4SA_3425 [Olavius algarvensis Delta 1 endosymbiont]